MNRQLTDEEILRKFTREMMGASVAHMTDEQLDAWMEPWRKAGERVMAEEPGFPMWFVKQRDEARVELIRVLSRRGVQLHMRDLIRSMHKSPFLRPGQWDEILETYRACFPGDGLDEDLPGS